MEPVVLPTHKITSIWKSLHTIKKIAIIKVYPSQKSQLNKLALMHVIPQGKAFLGLHGNANEASQGLWVWDPTTPNFRVASLATKSNDHTHTHTHIEVV